MRAGGENRLRLGAAPTRLHRVRSSSTARLVAAVLTVLPVIHPLLRPALGPPSHLLWFTHVFPVAWATYVWGVRGGTLSIAASVLSVVAGESTFGAGYGVPADNATRWALALAVAITELLVSAFARWIRSAEREGADLAGLAVTALDTSPDAVVLLDGRQRVSYANDVAQSLFGGDADPVVGRPLETLLDDARLVREITASAGGQWDGVARAGTGRPFPAQFRCSPVNDQTGNAMAWLVTIHDRTEELQHEESDRRNQALSELGTVVAGVAHELNNPLTTVTTYAELLGDQNASLPTDVREAVDAMAHEAKRAGGIVRQLLQRVRKSSDKRTGLDLSHVVQTVLKARAPQFAAHSIRAVARLDASLPPVLGSAGEIEQILVNLVANAQYAMHKARGGGELVVRAARGDGGVDVVVEDDGPGIPADVLPRMFEPFFSTKGADGNGLGLAIARRIARAHGGDLTVTNRPEGGARFVLRLPEAPSAQSPHQTPAQGPMSPIRRDLAVLVVDDEPGIRGSLTKFLARRGYRVAAAEGVEQARLLLTSERFDALLCDVHLGGQSGLDLYRSVTTDRPDLAGRWVFMTGDGLGSDVATFLEDTRSLHVSKPFELADILEAIERAAGPDPLPVAVVGLASSGNGAGPHDAL